MELGIGLTKIIPPAVYIFGILIILATLAYKVEFGIFYLVPLLPLQTVLDHIIQYPGGKDFMDFLFAAVIIKLFTDRNKLTENMQWRKTMYVFAGCIFIWTYIELWIGSYNLGFGPPLLGDDRFTKWKNFAMLPILYLITVNGVKDKKQVKFILVLMTLTMLFMDRNFYHNFAQKNTSTYSEDLRVGSTFSYLGPNETAVFYAQNSIVLLCMFLHDPEKRRRLLLGITTVFNYYCLMFLFSRGGYLATLLSWMFLGLIKDRRILVVLILVGLFWRSIVPISVQQRIDMSKTEEEGTDTSIVSRYQIWEQAIALISQNPITGFGYGTTPFLNISSTASGQHHRDSLHNGYLELCLELGVIGFCLFIAFYVMCVRYGWRLYKTAKDPFLKGFGLGFVGCVLAILGGNIAGSYLFYLNVSGFFWVNVGLVVRCLELSEQDDESETDEDKDAEEEPVGKWKKPRLRFITPQIKQLQENSDTAPLDIARPRGRKHKSLVPLTAEPDGN